MSAKEQVIIRRLERHGSAIIRACAGEAAAEYRKQLTYIGEEPVVLHVPYLALDVLEDPLARCRGTMDAIALRLRASDYALHRQLSPDNEMAMIVFDVLEQFRCEALLPPSWQGTRANLQYAFEHWCRECLGDGVAESELGRMLFAVVLIVRGRLIAAKAHEEAEGVIEGDRFKLVPLIGQDLRLLSTLLDDQQAYSVPALRIADIVAETLSAQAGEDEEQLDQAISSARTSMRMPLLPTSINSAGTGANVPREQHQSEQGYRVFTRRYDREVSGDELYRHQQCLNAREQLDQLIASQAINIPRLALQMRRLFAQPQQRDWRYAEEEGLIDGRRLSQLVAEPSMQRLFKQRESVAKANSAVTFLIDNSGSMKQQRYQSVAVLMDTLTRALELAGVQVEVLGYTTGGWTGGRAMQEWQQAGKPAQPGRMNEQLHVIYKAAKRQWRRQKLSLGCMLNTTHYREGLDGEALQWAANRLRQQDVERRFLVVISDGAPMDSATNQVNDAGFLDNHLSSVVRALKQAGDINLAAIGIALDMSDFYDNSRVMDLTGTLRHSDVNVLWDLFA